MEDTNYECDYMKLLQCQSELQRMQNYYGQYLEDKRNKKIAEARINELQSVITEITNIVYKFEEESIQ